MSKWTDKLPESARDWIAGRRVDEVECIIADIAGVARGKAMPASKFAKQANYFLPNSIFLQTITGEWADNPSGAFTEPDMILVPDFSTATAAPWTADVTLQIIHDGEDQEGDGGTHPAGRGLAERGVGVLQVGVAVVDDLREEIVQAHEARKVFADNL